MLIFCVFLFQVSGTRIPPRIESPFYQHSKCGDGVTNATHPQLPGGPLEPPAIEFGHTDHDHSGHDHSGHDHSEHDHSGHDHTGSGTGMTDQPLAGSMPDEHSNTIDDSTQTPDQAGHSKPNSSTNLINSLSILVLTVLSLLIIKQ